MFPPHPMQQDVADNPRKCFSIDRMLEMMSNAPTIAARHIMSNIA